MTYKESAAFIKDVQKVLKRHGMYVIVGPSEKLVQTTKNLEGYHLFFTKGVKKVPLKLKEEGDAKFENSLTIRLQKNRFKPENHEDDGN